MKVNTTYILLSIFHSFLLFYKNYESFHNHFVTSAFLDTISKAFCILGTIIVVINSKKREYFLLLLTYISTVICIVIASPLVESMITHGIFFLPFGFLFAGIGIHFFVKKYVPQKLAPVFLSVIFALIFIINFYQSQIEVFADKNEGYTSIALIIKSLQEAQHEKVKTVNLILSPSLQVNNYTDNLHTMIQAYTLQNVSYTITRPNEVTCSSNNNNHFLVLHYDTEAINQLQSLKCNLSYTIISPPGGYF